jgi:hypothetical protein
MSKALDLADMVEGMAGWNDEQCYELVLELRRLAEIEQAALKLVKCKGRYHTEKNTVALAKLVGVTLPPVTVEED